MTRNYHLICLAAVCGAAFAAPLAIADSTVAALYFTVPASAVPVGGTFSVAAMVDSTQPLNAYVVDIDVSGDAGVKYLGADNANSIVTVWQNLPSESTTPSGSGMGSLTISFEGGSLSPFEGKHGELMTFNFAAETTGTAVFSFGPSSVYLANGKGTKLSPSTSASDAELVLPAAGGATGIAGAEASGTPAFGNVRDTMPPDIEYLSIIGDPAHGTRKFLAFRISDAGSGAKETEVRYRTWWAWSPWQNAVNPAAIPRGAWEAELRATDNAGNVAELAAYDLSPLGWPVGIFAAIIAAISIFAFILGKRRSAQASDLLK